MAQFEATVRVLNLGEADALTARRKLEGQLQTAGFTRYQILNVAVQGAATPARRVPGPQPGRTPATYAGGGMLLAAILAWALWFLWLVAN